MLQQRNAYQLRQMRNCIQSFYDYCFLWRKRKDLLTERRKGTVKRKIIISIIFIVSVLVLMYAEYVYIIHNLCPYTENEGTVYIELFGRIDEYEADQF